MTEKALIIEDEPEIRAILAISLQRGGRFDTISAADGIEGIELAAKEMPDLILLDVMMPRMDGYATCSRIKRDERLSHIPVIFLTAKSDPRDIDKAIRAGAAGCIAKPFDPLTLTNEIARIVDGGGNGGIETATYHVRAANG